MTAKWKFDFRIAPTSYNGGEIWFSPVASAGGPKPPAERFPIVFCPGDFDGLTVSGSSASYKRRADKILADLNMVFSCGTAGEFEINSALNGNRAEALRLLECLRRWSSAARRAVSSCSAKGKNLRAALANIGEMAALFMDS